MGKYVPFLLCPLTGRVYQEPQECFSIDLKTGWTPHYVALRGLLHASKCGFTFKSPSSCGKEGYSPTSEDSVVSAEMVRVHTKRIV